MLPADIAKTVLPQGQDQPAKPAVFKEGAALPALQNKVRQRIRADVFSQLLSDFSIHPGVICKRVLINVDLPAHTATVGTPIGSTMKILIIIRLYCFHRRFYWFSRGCDTM